MLETVREYATHWFLKVLLGIIALVFIFWGFGAQNMSANAGEVAATVNGREIPLSDFQNLYEQQRESRTNRMLPSELQDQMLIGQVLDQLIEAELLRQFAEEMDIHVSKQELAERITELPFLQDEQTGKFIGKEKYLAFLEERGIDVAEFESDMRKDLVVDKARRFIEGSVKVTPDEVKQEWRARNEKVNLQFLRVDAASLAASMAKDPVSDDEVKRFEGKYPGLVEQLYADEKESRWTTPAKANLRQITLRKPAAGKGDADAAKRKAERVLAQATSDWKKAAELSEGPAWEKTGEPREMARREMPALIADKVFTMTPGAPATLIETPTSFAIVKLEALTPEKVTELDEKVKREIIVEQIRERRAEESVEAFAREAFEKLKAGQPIEKVAALKGLAVKETGSFSSRGQFPGIPEADPALVASAFKLTKPGEVLEIGGQPPVLGDGAILLAVLKEHTQPNEADYETQKVWVQSAIERQRAQNAFRSWKVSRQSDSKIVPNPRLQPNS